MCLKVVLLVILCYCPLIAQIKAQCIFQVPIDDSVAPLFFRDPDTHTTLILADDGNIQLNNGERIRGRCPVGFVGLNNVNYEILVECVDSDVRYSNADYIDWWNAPSFQPFKCTPYKAYQQCQGVELSSNKDLRPRAFKKIGTRNIQLSHEMQTITITHNQELTLQCETKFKSPSHLSRELNLICVWSQIVVLGHPYSSGYGKQNFECDVEKWNLYESKMAFPWCPAAMASYLLARPSAHNAYEYLAGICYDFNQLSLKSLYYTAKPKLIQNLAPTYLENYKPLMQISHNDEIFLSKRTFAYDDPKIEKWISFSNYQTASIVRDWRLLSDFFMQFDLLNINWWSGLKRGNWELYQEAMTKHIENDDNEYDILAGISKKVAVPIRKENCSKNITMIEVIDSENNSFPLYVWNYLRSLKNSSDDVVVIGVNTPFSNFYDEKELMFCNDICHTIDWLKDVHVTFGFPPMGIIFCCTIDEVLASERLDGFAKPQAPIPAPMLPPILKYGAYVAAKTATDQPEYATNFDESTENELDSEEYENLFEIP